MSVFMGAVSVFTGVVSVVMGAVSVFTVAVSVVMGVVSVFAVAVSVVMGVVSVFAVAVSVVMGVVSVFMGAVFVVMGVVSVFMGVVFVFMGAVFVFAGAVFVFMLRCTHKSSRVAPQALIPPTPLKKGGKKLSKSPNLSGDLGGSIHILHPAKRCVYTVAVFMGAISVVIFTTTAYN
ncbi:hypothetical protein H6G96_07315 [Nostoc sp. FACHB-892]|uniref:hypothetical protein n=1 Tax=Nostoc sp. FACHB-892 TaxID=2692843 RepID=UPI001688A6E6|nr:hypothetical protein [Nostoc sp. FACHB-892]MBD2726138.1 hypothetical protein [Nostoc sp. FACHB-892]